MSHHHRLLLAGVVLCLGFLLVGVAGGEQVAATDDSLALQNPADVAVASGVESADGEVELVVELPEHDGAATANRLQTHAAASQATLRQFAARSEAITVERQFWLTNAALVRVDTDRLSPRALARIEGVESIRPNAEFHTLGGQADISTTQSSVATTPASPPTVDGQNATASATDATYGLEQIRAPTAWAEYDTRGAGASVAVLDTGVDVSHPDIDLAGWAEFEEDGSRANSNPQDFDPSGHGTHVSGTVAGGAASGQQIGVAPDVDLYHGAALTDCTQTDCTGTFSQIVAGMEWAVASDVDVLSMSLGAGGYRSGLIDPVQNAQDAGTIVVAASGNRGAGYSDTPANVPGTIAVGASNSNEDIASFSNGEQIDTGDAWGVKALAGWPDSYVVPTIAAPGSVIESAAAGGGYDTKSGTSMATPHVAGAVALLQSATGEQLSPGEVTTALETTASKPADAPAPAGQRDTRYGSGIIDVPAALAAVDMTLSAAFTADPGTPTTGEPVVLDASATAGSPDSYEWDFDGDGQTDATGETVTTTFDSAGEKDVTLRVTGSGGTDSTSETVTVLEPVAAAFSVAPATPVAGTEVTFDASAATGDSYEWDTTGDGTVDATGEVATFSFWQSGEYDVTLTVTRNGETATRTRTVSVAEPLDAAFTAEQSGELTVTLDASPTTSAVEYRWDITGDGEVDATGERTTFSFWTAGSRTVTLTAVGANGDTATASQAVQVSEVPPVGDEPPQDLNGDGRYRDVRGNGELTILDVQTLFNNLGSDTVQSNPDAFNFDGAGSDEVTILDVQALFNDLSAR